MAGSILEEDLPSRAAANGQEGSSEDARLKLHCAVSVIVRLS